MGLDQSSGYALRQALGEVARKSMHDHGGLFEKIALLGRNFPAPKFETDNRLHGGRA